MIRVIHNKCGGIAFYFRERLYPGDILRSSNVILKDGSDAIPTSPIVCGSCHEHIELNSSQVEQQHWTDWFIPKEEIWKQNKSLS